MIHLVLGILVIALVRVPMLGPGLGVFGGGRGHA
jgi:hypothetical protein